MNSTLTLDRKRNWTELLRSASCPLTYQIAGIVTFVALTAIGAQVRIYLWEVPFTLQTVFVYGSGLFLGSRNGAISMSLYLLLGLFLPIFAGDGFGFSYLLGAVSVGYLLAFPLVSALIGFITKENQATRQSLLSLIAGSALLFCFGVIFLHFMADHVTWFESIEKGWLRFIPADLAKIMTVGLIYQGARRM